MQTRKTKVNNDGMIKLFSGNHPTITYCACIETPRINLIGN